MMLLERKGPATAAATGRGGGWGPCGWPRPSVGSTPPVSCPRQPGANSAASGTSAGASAARRRRA